MLPCCLIYYQTSRRTPVNVLHCDEREQVATRYIWVCGRLPWLSMTSENKMVTSVWNAPHLCETVPTCFCISSHPRVPSPTLWALCFLPHHCVCERWSECCVVTLFAISRQLLKKVILAIGSGYSGWCFVFWLMAGYQLVRTFASFTSLFLLLLFPHGGARLGTFCFCCFVAVSMCISLDRFGR